MGIYEDIINKKEKIAVVGLGYVGMPIAVSFSRKVEVIGFDVNDSKVSLYKSGVDPTNEVGNEVIKNCLVTFSSNEEDLKKAKFFIVAVPTPINQDKTPNLKPIEDASRTVGRNLQKGSYVVFESTVYPGVTEDICIPIIEETSGLKCGTDFKIGYSPERINPGDKIHRLENIKKVVSGCDTESLNEIAKVYEIIIEAGVFKTTSIKVAEATKVVENSQRDINIAFMNELAMVFDRLNIDTHEVIQAMNTKWNSLGFYPGLVGGHCIGVDPYYFIYEAEKLGYHSQIILSGRKINDSMGEFIGESIIKKLVLANKRVKDSKVVILGLTFKENCPDIRNTKVVDIVKYLNDYGIKPDVCDPYADEFECYRQYNIHLKKLNEVKEADCIVFAVPHEEYKNMEISDLNKLFKQTRNKEKIIIDVKSILDIEKIKTEGYSYWRL